MEDFQLQIEHALDLMDRQHVLLVDASVCCAAPFEVRTPTPLRDTSYSSHALSPEALLQVVLELSKAPPPSTTVLAIRGTSFELGASLGKTAQGHLQLALRWALDWIAARQSERVNRASTRLPSPTSTN